MKDKFVVGIQSWFLMQFLDEGIEQALDNMIEYAGVNQLLLATHIDYQSTKDWGKLTHAKAESFDCEGFNLDVDLAYYKKTSIKPVKTKIYGLANRDLFGEISKAAKKKGIDVFALIVHRFCEAEKYTPLNVRAVNGQVIPAVLCHSYDDVLEYYKGLADQINDRYDLDGFAFALLDHYSLFGFQSLTDELSDSLGIEKFSNPEMGLTCFCENCVALAKAQGIDVNRIQKGLLRGIELEYIPHRVEKMKTADEALRFLLDVPEYLEWLRFRSGLQTKLHRQLYEHIKNLSPYYQVGLDIYGAKDDWKYQTRFHDLAKYCDWIKPMFYSCTYDEPLSPIEIGEGVRLAKELSGKPIYPGINCLPSEQEEKIIDGIEYSCKNKADGVILSWDYALMPFTHMKAAKAKLESLKRL